MQVPGNRAVFRKLGRYSIMMFALPLLVLFGLRDVVFPGGCAHAARGFRRPRLLTRARRGRDHRVVV